MPAGTCRWATKSSRSARKIPLQHSFGTNRMKISLLSAAFLLAAVASATAAPGTSAFTTRLDDPRAIALTGAAGDGKTDDSAAIQAAIDKAAADREEGIVFIPQ